MDPCQKGSDATELKIFHYGLPDNRNNYFRYEHQLLYSRCEICRADFIIFISYFSSYSVRKGQRWASDKQNLL
jgi:hypothetical protein